MTFDSALAQADFWMGDAHWAVRQFNHAKRSLDRNGQTMRRILEVQCIPLVRSAFCPKKIAVHPAYTLLKLILIAAIQK